MDLTDYLRALRSHWMGAFLLTAVLGGAAFGYSAAQPKVYAASATGFVGTGFNSNAALGNLNDQLARSRATSYVPIATSRATAQRVIDTMHLHDQPSTLVGRIAVAQPLDTVVLKITARAGSPKGAQRLADAWVKAMAAEVMQIEAPGMTKVPRGVPRIIPVEAAELPSSPVEPQIARNSLLGVLVGGLLGLGYAVIRRSLDRRVRTPEDIAALVDLPVVGLVPTSRALGDRSFGTRKDSSVAETFRKLRTNLIYMDVDAPPRVIVVTSPRPGDGKSTTAGALAITLAGSGQHVVLVDADLRRPSVTARMGLEPGAGLTSVLSGQASIDEVLQEVPGTPSLRVLGPGDLPPNPSELLGSNAMRRLLETLAERGTVILDTPPLLPVTDAAVLAGLADGAFLVIRSRKTLDTELLGALNALQSVNARALGLIMNMTGSRRRKDRYYYAYYAERESSVGKRRRVTAVP